MCNYDFVAFPCSTAQRAYEEDEANYGYVKQYPKGAICVRLGLPDFSDLPLEKYEWTSIYGNIAEELPSDMPVP